MNPCQGLYDSEEDSYCSFVSYESFINDYEEYIEAAFKKRERLNEFDLVKRP